MTNNDDSKVYEFYLTAFARVAGGGVVDAQFIGGATSDIRCLAALALGVEHAKAVPAGISMASTVIERVNKSTGALKRQ